MTFETSLACVFVAAWIAIIVGWTVQELFFKPKFP